ncbi:MAG: thiamine pyrophosphate-dependent enzyme [Candidatus Margulisiibacteriota bacterium]
MELQPNPVIQRYLRTGKKHPVFFCPGCQVGIIMGALIRGINECNLQKDEIFLVSGVGCSGRMPVYLDLCSIQATRGRALAFATGVKMAKPHLKVIAVIGDGEAVSVGTSHLVQAARRNIDLTVVVINNFMHAMTGGQPSPTTPHKTIAPLAPYGNVEHPLDICDFAVCSGATFVGRQTAYHAENLAELLAQAIKHNGFSLVEATSLCHMKPERKSPVDALLWLKEKAAKGEIITGIFKNTAKPELTGEYEKIIKANRS